MNTLQFKPDGIIRDIPAQELPADKWSYGENMVNQNGTMKVAAGYRTFAGTPLFPPQYLLTRQNPGGFSWVYPGETGIGVTDGVNHFDITPASFTAGVPGTWTGANMNNLVVINNQTDPPVYWPGGNAEICLPLPDFPENTTVGWMRSYKYSLICGNINSPTGDYENQILWSNAADPGTVPDIWTPAPNNIAGDNILAATPGPIVDGTQFRDLFLLFKNHSTYAMSLVGGQFIYNFRKLFVTVGALANNCAIEYKGMVYILTDGDVVRTDGHSVQSIAEQQVRKTIFSELDSTNANMAFMSLWPAQDELWCVYPTAGESYPNRAAVYNLVSGKWGFRDVPGIGGVSTGLINDSANPITWDTQTTTWNTINRIWNQSSVNPISDAIVMTSPEDGALYVVGELATPNPVVFTALIQKSSFPLSETENMKTVVEVWPLLVDAQGATIYIRIGAQKNQEDDVVWSAKRPFVPGVDVMLNTNATGRLFSVEFSAQAIGAGKTRVNGFRLRYREGGRF